jgi:Uma2 family endonuclease
MKARRKTDRSAGPDPAETEDAMEWADICRDSALRNLPYKIQTDRWGNIVMSPASNEHGILQAGIVGTLAGLVRSGTIVSECSVQTRAGVKVADVAWASEAFMARNRGRNPFPEGPEICVEILSPSNSRAEMAEKKALYFAAGTMEFWLCEADGAVTFFGREGALARSRIFPAFPEIVEAG